MSINDRGIKSFFDVIATEFKNNAIEDPMEVGKVTNLDPLTIEVEGLPLYESNLDINKDLLAYDEVVIITYNNDNSNQSITIHHPTKLQVGNHVALYGLEWNEIGKTYQKYQLMYVIN